MSDAGPRSTGATDMPDGWQGISTDSHNEAPAQADLCPGPGGPFADAGRAIFYQSLRRWRFNQATLPVAAVPRSR